MKKEKESLLQKEKKATVRREKGRRREKEKKKRKREERLFIWKSKTTISQGRVGISRRNV